MLWADLRGASLLIGWQWATDLPLSVYGDSKLAWYCHCHSVEWFLNVGSPQYFGVCFVIFSSSPILLSQCLKLCLSSTTEINLGHSPMLRLAPSFCQAYSSPFQSCSMWFRQLRKNFKEIYLATSHMVQKEGKVIDQFIIIHYQITVVQDHAAHLGLVAQIL